MKLIIGFLLFLSSNLLYAAVSNETQSIIEYLSQIKLLKQQLEDAQNFQSSILSTVYWSLGSIVVLAGLLMGYGWFTNFKIYERDKESMKNDLILEIENKFLKISNDINSLNEEIKIEVDQNFVKIENNFENKLTSINKKLDKAMEAIESRFQTIEIETLNSEMRSKDSPSMALTGALKLLKACISYKKHNLIPSTIKFILDELNKGGKFTTHELIALNDLLTKLPDQYQTLVVKLNTILVEAEIF